MAVWAKRWALLALASAITAPPAAGYPIVPQNEKSKALLALPPAEADRVRRRALMDALQPGGPFLTDLNRNVYGMNFVTWPYPSGHWPVCEEDTVTLTYGRGDSGPDPRHIETQALFYVENDPSLRSGYVKDAGLCDKQHPGPKANWIAASSAFEAVRGAEVFRKAELDVADAAVKPAPCERKNQDACRDWIVSLNDLSKLDAVDPCPPDAVAGVDASASAGPLGAGEQVCYVISIGDGRLTISATMSADHPSRVDAITSIRVWEQVYIIE